MLKVMPSLTTVSRIDFDCLVEAVEELYPQGFQGNGQADEPTGAQVQAVVNHAAMLALPREKERLQKKKEAKLAEQLTLAGEPLCPTRIRNEPSFLAQIPSLPERIAEVHLFGVFEPKDEKQYRLKIRFVDPHTQEVIRDTEFDNEQIIAIHRLTSKILLHEEQEKRSKN